MGQLRPKCSVLYGTCPVAFRSIEVREARALTEPAYQQWPIAIAERSPTDLEFSKLRRVPVSYEGCPIEARRGVGQALDRHALPGRIAKAAEAHRVILSGVVLIVIRINSQEDPLNGLDHEVGSLFNPTGTVASEGQDRTVGHEPVRAHPSAVVQVHQDVLASVNRMPRMNQLDAFAGDGDRLDEFIHFGFLLRFWLQGGIRAESGHKEKCDSKRQRHSLPPS